MRKYELVNVKGRGPAVRNKIGRFEVSLWHWRKVYPAHNDGAEREMDVERASIRYSRFNQQDQSWEETSIWCSIDELRDLVQALDRLNLADRSGPE